VSPAPSGAREPASWRVEVLPEDRAAPEVILRAVGDPMGTPPQASGPTAALVFDGVLHNRAEIAVLAKREQRDDSDADILLHAYERLGEDLFRRLKGIFALIVWDGRSRKLLAARDPLGVVPLFYAWTDGVLLLSTSINTLRHDPRISVSPNTLSLAAHLIEIWPRSGETLLDPVRRLPPGHLARWRGRGFELFRYWDPAEETESFPMELADIRDRFDMLLRQSLDRCLHAGRAGIFLSGGLDSGTVAALAAERSRARDLPAPLALSLVYPHPSLNEEQMQRRVATGLGLPQVLLPFDSAVGDRGLLVAALKRAARSAVPPLNLWSPAYDSLIDEAARRGCKVILSGEGGDEWLVPPPLYVADRLAALDLRRLRQAWLARRRSAPFGVATTTRTVLWEWGFRPLLRQGGASVLLQLFPSATRSYRRRRVSALLPAWLAPDADLRRALLDLALDSLPDPAPGSLHKQSKRRLVGHMRRALLMEEWFEDGRSRSIRLLEPLLDPDLLTFLYHVPPDVLIHHGEAKWLARATLGDRIPNLVRDWPKPVYADRFWLSVMAREGPEVWRRLGGVPMLAELGLVDARRFDSAAQRAFSGTSFPAATQVWTAWTLETWLRNGLSPIMAC